jgi:hypothetical protein
MHRRLAFEKRVLGSVLGPKKDEGTGEASKFHNEKLPVDQTKSTA